jgi:CubicO group peptidase (beta-lactamase class C family)
MERTRKEICAWLRRQAKREATYEDLYGIPEGTVGEIINGELIVTPRPSRVRGLSAYALGGELLPPYQFGRGGGPGGWVIIGEPEIKFGENYLVPDIAGWRRERFPRMESDGPWSIDHAPDGLEKTNCCLAATAPDFAKLGRLYVHKGLWKGRRIVPETWVTESTRIDTSDGSVWNYQRLWWLTAPDRSDFMASGYLGQFLYVNPSAGVIIVRLGRSRGGLSRDEWTQVFMSLSDGFQRRFGQGT